ncbi:MAG: hypothetical protein AB7F23_04390 [Phycisphaerae bacterium]|jgi:hypothetical protein
MKKNIGIYYGEEVVVSICSAQALEQSFTLSASAEEEPRGIGERLAEKLASLNISIDYAGLILDSSKFVQHSVKSAFTDARRLSRTIKYDVEDLVGDNVFSLATSYLVNATEPDGTTVTVFTAKKAALQAILKDLQANGIDPEVIEPDSVSLMRLLAGRVEMPAEGSALIAAFAGGRGYIAVTGRQGGFDYIRSFTCASGSEEAAARNIRMTILTANLGEKVSKIYLTGQCAAAETVSRATDIETEVIELGDLFACTEADGAPEQAFGALIYSASIRPPQNVTTDFRADFSSFQGRKRIVRFSLSTLFIAATIVVGVFAWRATLTAGMLSRASNVIEEKIAEEYSYAMKGATMKSIGMASLDMRTQVSRLKRIKAGETADVDSVPTRLQFALEIINSMPYSSPVKLDSINITTTALRLDGSTKSRRDTQLLLSEVDKHINLERSQESLKQVGTEDSFTLNLNVKK